MGNPSYTVNFSKLFHKLLEENHSIGDKYNNSIIFLWDRNGDILTIHENGSLPKTILPFFNEVDKLIKTGVTSYSSGNFHMESHEICLPAGAFSWEGFLGMVWDNRMFDKKEISAFLFGFQQSLHFAAKLMEAEKKYEHFSKMDSVHYKITQILEETDFTNNVKVFAEHLLSHLYEYNHGKGKFILSIANSPRQAFLPVESIEPMLIQEKEQFTINIESFKQLYRPMQEKGFSVLHKKDVSGRHLFEKDEDYTDYLFIPINCFGDCIGVIMYLVKEGQCTVTNLDKMVSFTSALAPWLKRLLENEEMMLEKTRKDLLLKVNHKFHSSMDVNAILEEILFALHEIYPSFHVDLLLSHDWNVSEHLPIKPLDFTDDPEKDLAARAYLTGEIQGEDEISKKRTILYIPLKGKQGIYGVLKLVGMNTQVFSPKELEFVQVLADTGGNAIENAELYQQSQQYIANLQLINQSTKELNEKLKLSEVIPYLVKRMEDSFGADEVGFIMFDHTWSGADQILMGSTNYFTRSDSLDELSPIIKEVKKQQEGIFLGSREHDTYTPNLLFHSIMAAPMIHNKEVIGIVFVFGKEAYSFSFDTFKLFHSLVQHSTLAFVNSILHEELEYLVITDFLTKLYTRDYLDKQIEQSLQNDGYGSFILIDIDHFKEINDKYGHQVGDEVIIQVAKEIRKHIKENDFAARWGGEELAIYLGNANLEEARLIAEMIRKNVEINTSPTVTVSCGVSSWCEHDSFRSVKSLFNLADKAMYKAKNEGRNKVNI